MPKFKKEKQSKWKVGDQVKFSGGRGVITKLCRKTVSIEQYNWYLPDYGPDDEYTFYITDHRARYEDLEPFTERDLKKKPCSS
jgi:hypothetical protein